MKSMDGAAATAPKPTCSTCYGTPVCTLKELFTRDALGPGFKTTGRIEILEMFRARVTPDLCCIECGKPAVRMVVQHVLTDEELKAMAKEYVEVVSFVAVGRQGAEGFDFFVNLDTPAGPAQLPAPVHTLQSYFAFQQHVLVKTGFVYRYLPSEGRPVEAADENWRALAQVMLQRVPSVPPPNPMN